MNKKAIAILGAIFILIVGTLGFLIYSKYYGNKSATPPSAAVSPQPPTATSVPTNINGGGSNNPNPPPGNTGQGPAIVKLTDDQVISPVLFYNGSGITYFDHQGQLFQTTIDDSARLLQLTRKKSLGIPIKAGITKILWPSSGDDFIAEMAGLTQTWSYYNSQTGVFEDLPAQVTALDWMPGGKQILYIWLDKGKATLNIGDPDTKNWKYISDMWETDDRISISPDGKNILFYRQGSQDAANSIKLTTPDGKIWKDLVTQGYNYGVLWSPDSQKFLFGKKDPSGQKYQLWYYNLMTGEVRNLNLATTPDKAVWDTLSSAIYAAVPASGTAGGEQFTTDSFVKFDTSSSEKKQYQISAPAVDGRDLFLSKDGGKLFFRNAQDGGLYYLDLTSQ